MSLTGEWPEVQGVSTMIAAGLGRLAWMPALLVLVVPDLSPAQAFDDSEHDYCSAGGLKRSRGISAMAVISIIRLGS